MARKHFGSQDTDGVVYGTDHGTLGHLGPTPSGATSLRKTWELPSGGTALKASGGGGGGGVGRGVTALKRCDLTQDGVAEIVAGREDGTVTVSTSRVVVVVVGLDVGWMCKSVMALDRNGGRGLPWRLRVWKTAAVDDKVVLFFSLLLPLLTLRATRQTTSP